MTKKEARKLAKARRAAADLQATGRGMDAALSALPCWQDAATVLAFAALPDEPDTAPMLHRALAEGKRLLLPRVLGPAEMDWVEITDLAQLVPGAFGIPEAPADLPAFDVSALGRDALALVPCLAVSPEGVRLGRGKGYYDRFLAHYKGRRLVLCPEVALLEDLPWDAWDIRFSPAEILTEKGTLV